MVKIPYGKGTLELHEDVTVITPSFVMDGKCPEAGAAGGCTSVPCGTAIVEASMERPFGGKSLRELAAGKKTCVVIISDHTRPVPSRDILPRMLSELREGNPQIAVTFLVATGLHRKTTAGELSEKLGVPVTVVQPAGGAEFFAGAPLNAPIYIHDGSDPEKNVFLGTLPSGAPSVAANLFRILIACA